MGLFAAAVLLVVCAIGLGFHWPAGALAVPFALMAGALLWSWAGENALGRRREV